MEHLAILDKICKNANASMAFGTSIYIFGSAIYDTWINGNELEKNMAKNLILFWKTRLENILKWEYGCTRHHPNRLDYNVYFNNWYNEKVITYKDHLGIKTALQQIKDNIHLSEHNPIVIDEIINI